MKKIIYLILGVLLFIPTMVLADMGAPMIKGYYATPKNPDGADIYNYDSDTEKYVKTGKKLEYGKTVYIDNEESDYISIDEDSDDEVKLSDLVPVEKNYKVNEKELDTTIQVLVIQKQEIRKGPALGYDGTGKYIPAGTKIKVRYFRTYDEEEKRYYTDSENPWVYVEYNGTKGFITEYEGKIAQGGTYTTVIANDNISVLHPETKKKVATINANTKFNATVYTLDAWTDNYYIEYGNVKGIVSDEELIPKSTPISFKPIEKIKVYDKIQYDDEGNIISKVITTIPKGTTFKSEYYYIFNDFVKLYYENGNVKGWIEQTGRNVDENDEDSDYLGVDDILGFTYPDDDEIVEVEDEEEKTEEPDPTPIEDDTTKEEVKEEERETKKPETLYLCIGAAIIVSLTALVIILLVNKKKKM